MGSWRAPRLGRRRVRRVGCRVFSCVAVTQRPRDTRKRRVLLEREAMTALACWSRELSSSQGRTPDAQGAARRTRVVRREEDRVAVRGDDAPGREAASRWPGRGAATRGSRRRRPHREVVSARRKRRSTRRRRRLLRPRWSSGHPRGGQARLGREAARSTRRPRGRRKPKPTKPWRQARTREPWPGGRRRRARRAG